MLKLLPKVLVIVGPTASGKTALSIELAKKHNGEIISADSRQVYRGLNLGTGKVTVEEMQGIRHHLIDIVDPDTVYTASDFVRDARAAAADILNRGKLPIIVGGTFFYIDAFLGTLNLPKVPQNPILREELNKCSTEELFSRLQQLDPERTKSIDPHNPRRLVRAIEIASALGAVPTQPSKPLYDAHIFCIQIPPTELRERIRMRLKARLDAGMIEEVRLLHSNGLSYKRMEELGLEYRYIAQHLQGALSYQELTTTLEAKIWQYAKRQLTWLKKDTSIKCGDPDGKAAEEAG